MKKFFVSIIAIILLGACATGTFAFASSAKAPEVANCKAGCGNESAPGTGTGQSACRVTFVAADEYFNFEAQIFSPSGEGLLRNAKGQVAIRGGKIPGSPEGTRRVSVDCSAIRLGEKIVMCFTHDGKSVTRTIKGKKFKGFLPAGHIKGGIEVKL